MKISVFSSKAYDQAYFTQANQAYGFELEFYEVRLDQKTARLAHNSPVVCAFVNDDLSEPVLQTLAANGTRLLAMRCAGYNNVDLEAAKKHNITVVRVPAYSPEAVAEHTVGLMMTLNRRIHKAYQRTRDANFSLDGLVGFNMYGKTAGIIGTGKIGVATLRILKGFGMRLLVHDPYQNPAALELGAEYVDLDTLLQASDVISLHCPLFKENHHMLDAQAFAKMKKGVMIINTSRGALLNALDAIEALKQGVIGSLGLDVYEEEQELFFEDKSNVVITDDVFRRLSACHNVLFTGHQAFLTKEALLSIAGTTFDNVNSFQQNIRSGNEVEFVVAK
ncbi:D-lactate dehydrogenase [Vibrio gazogenes DSM 21264]|uniref:D-lactate dehydrogenase n=2 Tax=Vibrio gazogenes TaxID=687 RepID=A0A1M4VAE8_VIBGA|nr:2-hydroxyacid dehydrogenase [Vibrio gazogenes]SHE65961.1 D-lactate dehydrogenase [Vibrio gazogenes DSM 21264] [Vibrio gazogenes DSM 21264 = NBRC 103151]SJN57126.1 D-lactate dehydrogenase [Vibrio gazogenes]